MSLRLIRPLHAPLLAVVSMSAQAQVLSGIAEQKGGGLLQTCDTSLHVDFSVSYLDNYACQFSPSLEAGDNQVTGTTWHYYDYGTSAWQDEYGAPLIPYSSPQPYPVCYAVEAFDLIAAQPCSAAVCKVITPFQYAACADLTADFTIGAIDGSTITFQDLSSFTAGQIAGAFWSFDEGATVPTTSPTHTFTGPGPHQVCLTVVGPPPMNCTATACQWLYMGPTGLACDALVEQGFVVLAYQELVGVLDTSITHGMSAEIEWDFGDGALATGSIAVHAYDPYQAYDLCGTLRVWGPLLSDTCVSTICKQVFPVAEVSVNELPGWPGGLAWPSPFDEELRVSVTEGGGDLLLLDATGRVVMQERIPGTPSAFTLPTSALPPGCYTLLVLGASGRRTQRVVKQP